MNADEELKRKLSAWNVEVEPPARFQANVWAQIAARESSRRSVWDQLREWIVVQFYKPQLAAAVVTMGLALSMGIAYLQAQDSNAVYGKQLETRYMETINPLARAGISS